ncbi:DUF2680 domain-containing protein [Ferviditalea candida]|uniref:DUF2680 domain-containing protein n=1 Tax=Ferviditalea candida TaxID=3108399 RepID=A0ABU5ZC29_9BACL|nr:DUF2680 domain-containing protein [Paenibacillaceae bacterium T2]
MKTNKRRWLMVYLLACLLLMPNLSHAQAVHQSAQVPDDRYEREDDHHHDCTQNVKLTDKQSKELSSQYDRLYETKKKIIETYEAYGLYTKEQKERKLDKLKQHIDWIKKNNYQKCGHWGHKGYDYHDDRNEKNDHN